MDLGFKKAGFKIIWANDIYKPACETYKKNFGVEPVYGDIRKIEKFRRADVLVACNPCQGFSMIGNREPDDRRNFLYLEIFRVIRQVRPKYVVVENVRGLISLYGGRFFKLIKRSFRRHGYDFYWKLLNAKDYGVPQHRERVIFVGVRRDLKVKYEFPEATHGQGPGLKPYVNLRKAIGRMKKAKPDEYYNKDDWPFFYMSRNRRPDWNDVSFTIQAEGRQVPLHPSCPPMRRVEKDKFEFTDSPGKYRRLSAKECARIQSFPASFKFVGPLSTQYTLIGNAVPPKLARAIAESIMKTERARVARVAAAGRKRAKRKTIRRRLARMVLHEPAELAVAQRIRPVQIAHRRKAVAANRRWTRFEGLPQIHKTIP